MFHRSFLKILHTYQREQKGIKDVLEQVSNLFADHADLLMEFTYFLPDNVQGEAKERLSRAVREMEQRKRNQMLQLNQTKTQLINGKPVEMPAFLGPRSAAIGLQQQLEAGSNSKKR